MRCEPDHCIRLTVTYPLDMLEEQLYDRGPLSSNPCREGRMTQKPRNENARVVCLFCGTRTFVPSSEARYSASQSDSGAGITLIRCHVCCKEAPYSASEIFQLPEVSLPGDNSRSRAAGF
jgi:hypothetical protein